jgi:molybdopterin converting factor small subunit
VRDHGALAEFEPVISCAVNEEYARWTTPLSHGDEVAFLPPVSDG